MDNSKHAGVNIFTRWLRGLSIGKSLSIIIFLIILVLLFEFGNFWLSMKIASGIRSYVGGEGLWSKSQKGAANSLLTYSITFNESDYNNFLRLLQNNIGYKEVRLEMDKPHPDYAFIRDTWIKVGINSGDVGDDYFLYRNFKNVIYMQRAIRIWSQADEKIQEFIGLGQQLHMAVTAPYDKSDAVQTSLHQAQIDNLVKKVSQADQEFTVIENSFSASLGDGARAIKNILIIVTAVLTAILGIFVIFVAASISKIIIRVDKDKTEFISIASHQLNTPLSIMKNAYTMVQDHTLTVEQGMDYWGSGLKRMAEVVDDFWNVFKLEEGVHPNIGRYDIEGVVRSVVEEKNNMLVAAKKNLAISIENPSFQVPEVLCDINQINNIIYNLLDNAVSYTPQGLIMVNYALIENGTRLRLSIKDTGIGFSKEDSGKLTKKFYRAKRALLTRPDGSGLGLYICKSLIESNKGIFSYESEGEGKGAVFSFALLIAT